MKKVILIAATAALLSSALLTSGAVQANGFPQAKQPSIGNSASLRWCFRWGKWELCKNASENGKGRFIQPGLLQPGLINPKLIQPGRVIPKRIQPGLK